MSFQEKFEELSASKFAQDMLRNLARVAQLYAQVYPEETAEDIPRDSVRLWSTDTSEATLSRVDRTPEEIFAAFEPLTPEDIISHVDTGVVVDVGAGRSRYLTSFPKATRFAVEPTQINADFQEGLGNNVINDWAHNLGKTFKPGTVRCLNLSYSMPYWSASKKDSVAAARGILKVLEPGGIALIKPVLGGGTHYDQERIASTAQQDVQIALLGKMEPSSRWWTMNRMAFWETILARTGTNKELRIAAFRHLGPTHLSRAALPVVVVLQKQ